ncbi:ATP-binding protein [Psychromarinibacter sp. S121]|uniref:hybrid sensor histidine kinase/response regulator n=1 Tax=Psychromarinibacter sp. S121 TaxID=3415127 RepID=UPI003C7B498D
MALRPSPMSQGDDGSDLDYSVLLSDVMDAQGQGLAIFDEDATLLRCNASFRGMINNALADILEPGLSWDMLLREFVARGVLLSSAAQRFAAMEEQLDAGEVDVPPFEMDMPNGAAFQAKMQQTSTGGFLLSIRDITARRKLAESAREADELLEKVLEACPANVVMSRVGDGQILYRSPAATELLGTTKQTTEHFASREERADFITALLPDGRLDDMNVTSLRPDGARFPSLVSARLIDYRGEEVMVSSTVDISREVEMRRKLAEQREQIFQAEKMSALGELLAGVAHELNNPLSVVVGQALMLREENTDPETLRRVEKISDAAERCARIVKSFLAMARQQPVRLVPIDVGETVEMAIDALLNGTDGLSTEVQTDLGPDLPQVRGDAHQLAQVVINLITNAEQAIRDSGTGDLIRVALRHDARGDAVELVISDNGPGIPDSIRRRIFDPLFTTKPVGTGTGLGLALAHRVIAAHDGQIRFEPEPGGGARFVIHLPVTVGGDGQVAEVEDAETSAANARILVIDDEQDVCDLIREVLEKEGFAVDIAGTAEAGLEKLSGQVYTLVLTDLNMPGMGGRGLYETVLRTRPHMAQRIGFVTGDTMSPQASGFLNGAGRPYLEKPIAPAELRKLAHSMLSGLKGGRK